jgi:integrase/recombinase XerD
LWPEKGKRWPCLRSFRHTFAVRRLRTWYEEGADLTTLLPHLSVYLGHVSPEETYWYLTATPELLGIAAERFRSYVYKGGDR